MGLCVTFFFLLDLFSGPGYSPESSKYTVLVSRRLNPVEKQGTRPGWHPQCRQRVGRPGLRDHGQEEQWQRHPRHSLSASAPGPALGDALCPPPWEPRTLGYDDKG